MGTSGEKNVAAPLGVIFIFSFPARVLFVPPWGMTFLVLGRRLINWNEGEAALGGVAGVAHDPTGDQLACAVGLN